MAHAQNRGALCYLNLDGLIAQVQERDSRLSRNAQNCAAHVQLASGALIGPELVSGRQRMVRVGFQPSRCASRLKRNGTFDEIQSRDPAGRVGILSLSQTRQGEQQYGNYQHERGAIFCIETLLVQGISLLAALFSSQIIVEQFQPPSRILNARRQLAVNLNMLTHSRPRVRDCYLWPAGFQQ
jgi:hypothetical protein